MALCTYSVGEATVDGTRVSDANVEPHPNKMIKTRITDSIMSKGTVCNRMYGRVSSQSRRSDETYVKSLLVVVQSIRSVRTFT